MGLLLHLTPSGYSQTANYLACPTSIISCFWNYLQVVTNLLQAFGLSSPLKNYFFRAPLRHIGKIRWGSSQTINDAIPRRSNLETRPVHP